MRVRNILLFMLLVVIGACVDPLKVPDIPVAEGIVVDGAITDQPGPYSVKLFTTQSLEGDLDRQHYIRGATVVIHDDRGTVTTLTEDEKGIYTTEESFRGRVGYTYQLFISLSDGRQYASSPVLMEPAGTIADLYFQFQENVINENVLSLPQDAFAVFVDAKGTAGASNFFRWRATGTFHYRTFPELRTRWVRDVEFPDPLPCSGYVYEGGVLSQVAPCECCDCWATEYSTDAFVSNNDFSDDMTFNAVQIARIPLDRRLFYEKYHIEVEQLSLSQDVYAFWKLVQAQQQGSGDIFQPAIVKIKKIKGTIQCTSDPDEKAYGIFTASAVVKTSIFITPNDIPKLYPLIDTLRDDCRGIYPGATTTRPPFW
jgi:hypothetical protein